MIFTKNDKEYTVDDSYMNVDFSEGLSLDKMQELIARASDTGIPLERDNIKKLYDAEHRGDADTFISNFKILGVLKRIPMEFNEDSKKALTAAFESRHGRSPRVIDSITRIYDFYRNNKMSFTADMFVSRFSIPSMQTMLGNHIPECQAVLLYMNFSPDQCNNISTKPEIVNEITRHLVSGVREHSEAEFVIAEWLMEHNRTNEDTLKKISKEADRLSIKPGDTVEYVENRLNNLSALNEAKKIEKAYKKTGFKLNDCICELKGVEDVVTLGRYQAYIMRGNDERQVRLGYDTHCCQKLGSPGESSMMHGLLNPKAGFWVVEERKTGIIKAQAEVWEENTHTLVFDNIEMANDAELDLYKPILKKWLKHTEYSDVKMGTGYNIFMNGSNFRSCGRVTPTITPYEAYVLSYEDDADQPDAASSEKYVPFPTPEAKAKYIRLQEKDRLLELKSEAKAKKLLDEGVISYFTYVYCDSENNAVWLKENGRLESYFRGLEFDVNHLARAVRQIDSPAVNGYVSRAFGLNFTTQGELLPAPEDTGEYADEPEEEEAEEEEEEDEYDYDDDDFGRDADDIHDDPLWER